MKKQQFKLNMDHTLTTDFEKRIVDVGNRRYLLLKNGNHIVMKRFSKDIFDIIGFEKFKLYGDGQGLIELVGEHYLLELEFGLTKFSLLILGIVYFFFFIISIGLIFLIGLKGGYFILAVTVLYFLWYLIFKASLSIFIEELIYDFKLLNS